MAILEVERGRTLVVAVGEKIGDTDAVLHQVLPGEILIDRDGTIESVKMVRKTLSIASLDPALSSNLPQPYIEQGNKSDNREINFASSDPRAVPLSQPSSGYQASGNENEPARSGQLARTKANPPKRSGQLVRFPSRRGFQSSDDENEDENEDEDEREDGEGARLPIPRALRN